MSPKLTGSTIVGYGKLARVLGISSTFNRGSSWRISSCRPRNASLIQSRQDLKFPQEASAQERESDPTGRAPTSWQESKISGWQKGFGSIKLRALGLRGLLNHWKPPCTEHPAAMGILDDWARDGQGLSCHFACLCRFGTALDSISSLVGLGAKA